MEIVKEQHCRLKEARLNLTTPLTSETGNYGEGRPKTTSRAKTTPFVLSTLPQGAAAPSLNSCSRLRHEQLLEHCAALLRDEIFNIILGTVNIQCNSAS